VTGSAGQDIAQLAAEVLPYVSAAVGAYGMRVLDQIGDDTVAAVSDATVGLGRRLLDRLLTRRRGETDGSAAEISRAVRDLAASPTDSDAQAALRLRIRAALAADPELAAEVRELLPAPALVVVTAHGARSVAAQSIVGSVVVTGDGSLPG